MMDSTSEADASAGAAPPAAAPPAAPAPAAPAPAAPAPAPAPASAPAGSSADLSSSSAFQSFQDLDISPPSGSLPATGAAATGQGPRFDAKAAQFGGPAAAAASAAVPDLSVVVTNASKQGEGYSAYFTYEVATKTSLPQYQFGQFSVTRRFRDFDWLHSQLCAKFPGAIVPPLPEKHAASSSMTKAMGQTQTAEWIEERRSKLQQFLLRVVAHPQMHTARDLQAFLEAPDETLESWKETAKQASKKDRISLNADELKKSALKFFSAVSDPSVPPDWVATQDLPCTQMAQYTDTLTTHVTSVHKHSKAYIDKYRAISTSMEAFAAALKQLASVGIGTNELLAKSFTQMGLTAERVSTMYADQHSRGVAAFEEPMAGYIRILGAVKQAVSARESALKRYNDASAAHATKRVKLEKAKASKEGKGKEEKVAAATRELTVAEEADAHAKSEFEAIVGRVDAEMARFQLEKLADFKKFVIDFVKLQIEYSTRVQAAWRDLTPTLDAMQDASAPSATSAEASASASASIAAPAAPRIGTDKVELAPQDLS